MRITKKLSMVTAAALVFGMGVVGTAAAVDDDTTALTASLAEAGPVSSWVPIESYRAFDSREVQGDVTDRLFSGAVYYLDVTTDAELTQKIPSNATGVTFNATVVRTNGRGFVQIAEPDVEVGSTSTLNFFADNQVIANSGSVQLGSVPVGTTTQLGDCTDGGCVLVHQGGAEFAGADWFIDITGYYVSN